MTLRVVLLLICLSYVLAKTDLIGVSPEDAKFFSGKFYQCRESLEMIPIDAVNDDFCDCKDGSDEPGTSACSSISRGKGFFCKNKGHFPKHIFTSQVNDGICDCCDGSDEYFGFGKKCENTCQELGKEQVEALEKEIRLHRKGAQIKAELIVLAQHAKPQLFQLIEDLEKQFELKSQEQEQLKKLEDSYKEMSDAARILEKEMRKREKEQEEEEEEDEEEEIPEGDSKWIREDEESDDNDAKLFEREKREKELDEKRNDFIAKYSVTPDEATKLYDDARASVRTCKNEVNDLSESLRAKKTLSQTDFGKDSEYYVLSMETVSHKTDEYTYTLQPFLKMMQGSTELGNWEGWNDGYSQMLYKRGRKCWGAGDRETIVFVHCGLENKLSDISEPSTCIYNAHLYTPAACSEEYALELEQQLFEMVGKDVDADFH